MNRYTIYVRLGLGHNRLYSSIDAENIKTAYKEAVAVVKDSSPEICNKITKLLVAYHPQCNDDKGKYHSYGYDPDEWIKVPTIVRLKTNPFKA